MNINKTKLLDNFKNIKNFINFNFLICYKKLFTKEGILYNIGCYLIFAVIILHIITIFIFSIKQFSLIENIIKNISIEIYNYPSVKSDENQEKKDKLKKPTNNVKRIYFRKKSK